MSKEKEVIKRVLSLYRTMDFLWDKKHKDYSVRRRRDDGYQELLEIFKEIDEHATTKSMIKKLQNLRTNYIKEHKKLLRKRMEGEDYVPTLWYYDDLSFLETSGETYPYHLTTSDPLDPEDASVSYLSDAENDQRQQPQAITSPPANITPRKRKRATQSTTLHYVEPESEEYPQFTDYEWEIIAKAIGLQLRELKKRQLTITQKLISDVIYYGSLGMLSENSLVAVQPVKSAPNPAQLNSSSYGRGNHGGDMKQSPVPASPSSSYYNNDKDQPPSPSYC